TQRPPKDQQSTCSSASPLAKDAPALFSIPATRPVSFGQRSVHCRGVLRGQRGNSRLAARMLFSLKSWSDGKSGAATLRLGSMDDRSRRPSRRSACRARPARTVLHGDPSAGTQRSVPARRHPTGQDGDATREGNMTDKAKAQVFIDNERVRVTEWRFAPGAATGWHRHEMDYVVVPMLDGALELVGPDNTRHRTELRKGVPYF